MKKLLSIILAALMMFTIGTVAFAHENVDNTFDNYTPQPGQEAPDNWYDPFCYDDEGLIVAECFPYKNCTYYCKASGKIYTNSAQPVPGSDGKYYAPYEFKDDTAEYGVSEYCPYCGIVNNLYRGVKNNSNTDYSLTHTVINDVYYGATCHNCGEFPVSRLDVRYDFFGCTDCWRGFNPDKFYRFIPKAYEEAEFAHIFTESEHKFGEGQDGYIEDVGTNSSGYYVGWNPGSSDEPAELTFWDKIVQFFVSIGDFFVKLFTWSW